MLRPDGGPAWRAETDAPGSALLVDVDAVADGQVGQGVGVALADGAPAPGAVALLKRVENWAALVGGGVERGAGRRSAVSSRRIEGGRCRRRWRCRPLRRRGGLAVVGRVGGVIQTLRAV